jgi:hypothetical protein
MTISRASGSQSSLAHNGSFPRYDFDINELTKISPNPASALVPSRVTAPSHPSRALSPLQGVEAPTLIASNSSNEARFKNDGDEILYVLGSAEDERLGNYIYAKPIKKGESAQGDAILFPDAQGRVDFANGTVFKAANSTSWNARVKLERGKDGNTSYQPSATTANIPAMGQGAYRVMTGKKDNYGWMTLDQFKSLVSTPNKNTPRNDPHLRKIWLVNEVPAPGN